MTLRTNTVFIVKILSIFKQLHKTRKTLYQGDEPNLAKARAKINEEFKKHKLTQNEDGIPELIAVAKDVEYFYRTRVVQAVPTEDGKHSKFIWPRCNSQVSILFLENFSFAGIRITADTDLVDNVEYDPVRVAEHSKNRPKRPKTQCCQKKD